MNITHFIDGPARPSTRLRRRGRVLLAVAGLGVVLLGTACDTAQQVPWATYSSQLQQRIDAAVATGDCAILRVLLTAAKATSTAHEKATGYPNDALVSYVEVGLHTAGCPATTG